MTISLFLGKSLKRGIVGAKTSVRYIPLSFGIINTAVVPKVVTASIFKVE